MRGFQYSQPIQDSYDEITNRVTTHFLGRGRLTCISCHDGARHLEPINLFLASQRRDRFLEAIRVLSRASTSARVP